MTQENNKNIYQRMCEIQKEIKVGKKHKSNFGRTGSGYAFRKAEDILNALKDFLLDDEYITTSSKITTYNGHEKSTQTIKVFDKNTKNLTQETINESCNDVRFYVEVLAKFHKRDKTIEATAQARESLEKKGMDQAQLTGATISYAKKYALCNLFAIDNEKDHDELVSRQDTKQNTHQAPQKTPTQLEKNQSETTYNKIINLIKEKTENSNEEDKKILQKEFDLIKEKFQVSNAKDIKTLSEQKQVEIFNTLREM